MSFTLNNIPYFFAPVTSEGSSDRCWTCCCRNNRYSSDFMFPCRADQLLFGLGIIIIHIDGSFIPRRASQRASGCYFTPSSCSSSTDLDPLSPGIPDSLFCPCFLPKRRCVLRRSLNPSWAVSSHAKRSGCTS